MKPKIIASALLIAASFFVTNVFTASGNKYYSEYVLKIGNFDFIPYISNEIYYDFGIERLNLDRATQGTVC